MKNNAPVFSFYNLPESMCLTTVSLIFAWKVGNDEFGYMLSDILMQNGVDNSGLLFEENARTALAFYSLKSDGEPEFMFYRNPSADVLLSPEQIDMNLVKKVTAISIKSIWTEKKKIPSCCPNNIYSDSFIIHILWCIFQICFQK